MEVKITVDFPRSILSRSLHRIHRIHRIHRDLRYDLRTSIQGRIDT